MKLYDALRCPFCARVRVSLAEKELAYEQVAIDLANRPDWLYELNPLGKVPVLDDDGFVLPESEVIMQYLDDRFHETPRLLPTDPRQRAEALLAVYRFDDLLGDDYYAFRREEPNRLAERLDALQLGRSLFVDIAYAPWVMRSRDMLGLELPGHLEDGLARLVDRPAFAVELEIVQAL